jgi:hypothetical protein
MLKPEMSSARYRIVVKEELGPRYLSAFEGLEVHAANGETEISGQISDASHLQAVLERIAGLGLTLRSVTPLENGEHVGEVGTRTGQAG